MKKIKLGDVCQFSEDRTAVASLDKTNYISTENLLPDRNGIIDAATLPKTSTTPEFVAGNVLLSNIRPYFKKIWYATFDGGCSADVLVLKVNESIDAKFLYYALSEDKFFDYMTATAKGTKMPRGDKLSIMNYSVPDFSLTMQKKIAALLGALDDKIALNKKINATLEAMAKTLYDYWFVQFDFPYKNGKPYKTNGGKMIYNTELRRYIPVGWEVDTLENFGTLKNGINYDKNTIGDCRVKIVNVKDISNSNFSIATESLDDINLPEEQIRKYLTTSKDILIARSGIPGAVRTLADEKISSIYCGFIICFQPQNEFWKNFLMLTLQKHYEIISTQSAGTIMQNITQDTLKNFRLIVPPLSVLENFNCAVELMISEMNTNILGSRCLAELRDWLLPMLMNGQVNFKEI